jgi:hypothetical protein
VDVLARLIDEHAEGELTLVTLGPLTSPCCSRAIPRTRPASGRSR